MLILQVGHLLHEGYEAIVLLYQPVTYATADVISTYVYREGIVNGRYDMAAAVGLFNSVIGFILIMVANKLQKVYRIRLMVGECKRWRVVERRFLTDLTM